MYKNGKHLWESKEEVSLVSRPENMSSVGQNHVIRKSMAMLNEYY